MTATREDPTRSDEDRFSELVDRLVREYVNAGYSDTAVAEANAPHNMQRLANPDAHGVFRGWCGDTMEIFLTVRGQRIEMATFITDGCGGTIACGSMLTKLVMHRSIDEARAITPEQLIGALDGLPQENEHCAELAVQTLGEALSALSNAGSGESAR